MHDGARLAQALAAVDAVVAGDRVAVVAIARVALQVTGDLRRQPAHHQHLADEAVLGQRDQLGPAPRLSPTQRTRHGVGRLSVSTVRLDASQTERVQARQLAWVGVRVGADDALGDVIVLRLLLLLRP